MIDELNNKQVEAISDEELAQISGGGATVRVRGDDIARIHTSEATATLQGKVAGVKINSSQGQTESSCDIKLR